MEFGLLIYQVFNLITGIERYHTANALACRPDHTGQYQYDRQ